MLFKNIGNIQNKKCAGDFWRIFAGILKETGGVTMIWTKYIILDISKKSNLEPKPGERRTLWICPGTESVSTGATTRQPMCTVQNHHLGLERRYAAM